jgi:hypothetical protein
MLCCALQAPPMLRSLCCPAYAAQPMLPKQATLLSVFCDRTYKGSYCSDSTS